MGTRRIKHFGGQQATLPIKNDKQLRTVMLYLLQKKEHAKTPIKYYLAYRNYMLFLIGFNTAFRAEDLLQLRVKDVIKGFVSILEFLARPAASATTAVALESPTRPLV